MGSLAERVERWWAGRSDLERREATVLAWICMGYLIHYLVFCLPQPFFIEDAGISFAYAENLVNGEGLVPWPGAERVEGYSNALWTFLVAGLYAIGVPSWIGAKLLGALFGVVTLPLVAGIVRRAEVPRQAALLAPALLAASPQFVIWNASGLENSLFNLLLAGGAWSLLRAVHEGRTTTWAGLCFFGLAATRPEGVAYATFGGLALVLHAIATRQFRPLFGYLVAFGLPFLAYNLWRMAWFAWPFPNTYYAKLGKGTTFKPFNFEAEGWKYVGRFVRDHGVAFLFPAFAAAATGLRDKRRWLGLPLSIVLAIVVLWDGKAGLGEYQKQLADTPWAEVQGIWMKMRTWTIAGVLGILGLASLGTLGWRTRGLLWVSACFAGFFAVYSNGDWMKAHRWFGLASVPLYSLLAIGVGDLLDAIVDSKRTIQLDRPGIPFPLRRGLSLQGVVLSLLALVWLGSESRFSYDFATGPETSVRDIHRRVRYMAWAQRVLDVDRVRLMDVDMGAHMLYSGWEITDIAGLIDVSMARHADFERRFMQEYVMEEHVAEFAHVHSNWARASRIPQLSGWKDQYVEIPGYVIGENKHHVGNHVLKSLFVHRDRPQPERPIARFADKLNLVELHVSSPKVAPGGELFIETTWQSAPRKADFRIVAFLQDEQGRRVSETFAPGYGWYPATDWRSSEQVDTHLRLRIPADLPLGSYRLGLLLLETPAPEKPEKASPKNKGTDKGVIGKGKVGTGKATDKDNLGTAKVGDGRPVVAGTKPSEDAEDAPPTPASEEGSPGTMAPTPTPAEKKVPPVPGVLAYDGTSQEGVVFWVAGSFDTGQVVEIVRAEVALTAAEGALGESLDAAANLRCEEVWSLYKKARRFVGRDAEWQRNADPQARRALSNCLARSTDGMDDERAIIEVLADARRWDHNAPELQARAEPLAERLNERGTAHFEAEEWEVAYRDLADALRLDASLAWTRRMAEDARDYHHHIVRPGRKREDMPWYVAPSKAKKAITGDSGGEWEEAAEPTAGEAPKGG